MVKVRKLLDAIGIDFTVIVLVISGVIFGVVSKSDYSTKNVLRLPIDCHAQKSRYVDAVPEC